MEHGQQIAYFGEGEPMVDGEPGDLQVVLRFVLLLVFFFDDLPRLQPHAVFERRGPDLYTNLTISLEDAMTGFSTKVRYTDLYKNWNFTGHTLGRPWSKNWAISSYLAWLQNARQKRGHAPPSR